MSRLEVYNRKYNSKI